MGNMTPETKVRLLSVDDSVEVRRVFELVMSEHAEFQMVGSRESAEGLENSIVELEPDVVVLDLSMPGRNPLEAMKSATAQFPTVRFLVSSAYDDPAAVEIALAAGATGYLVKDGDLQNLMNALRQVANGQKVVPQRRLRTDTPLN
jgi:DNA-binding NarL/FixJ family response regulator